MLVGIHQLHYLPWLRYFEKIDRCDAFVVLDNIQFTKNDWQNRNKVKTAGGVTVLTVPVHVEFGQTLDEVRIDRPARWRTKHWRTIQQAYGKAPHFAAHAGFLEATYGRDWTRLNDLNRSMIEYFVQALGIKTAVAYASDFEVSGHASERLVNLIKAVGGNAYYTGAHAADTYLDKTLFAEAGIEIEVQRWQAPEYPQLHGPFAPDLSIVDLLLNCGPESLDVLRRGAS